MSEAIDTSALPAVITRYLAAHQARDLDPALVCYTDDAVTVDEGHAYRGKREIRDWLARSASEYTWSCTVPRRSPPAWPDTSMPAPTTSPSRSCPARTTGRCRDGALSPST